MKQTLLFFFVVIASLSCHTNKQVATGGSQIGLHNLNHYYLKNSVALNSNYNGIFISDADNFNSLFYFEDSNSEKGFQPDFNGQIVVALALNTAEERRINFIKAEIKGASINVYGKIKTEHDEIESTPVAVATLPKYMDAKDVNFYIDGNLVKTVHVVAKNKSNNFAEANREEKNLSTQKEMKKKPAVV